MWVCTCTHKPLTLCFGAESKICVRPNYFITTLSTESDELDAELAELAALGFTGCLSAVRFNSISPLKAALLHPDGDAVVTGPLVPSSCGSSSPAKSYTAETTHSLSGTRSRPPPPPAPLTHLSNMSFILFLATFTSLFYWLVKHPRRSAARVMERPKMSDKCFQQVCVD